MDNIKAAMLLDKNASTLDQETRDKAVKAVRRLCPDNDHNHILIALGLIDPPPTQPETPDDTIEHCPNGHPKTPENLRRTRRGTRCRICENTARQRRRERERAEGTGYTTTPRGTTNSCPSDIERNTLIGEACKTLGLSWRQYKALYGGSGAIAKAVLEAATENDTDMLERLKKENR